MAKTIEIKYIMSGEQKTLCVKDTIPYHMRKNLANAIATDVVTEDGSFFPWRKFVLFRLNVLIHYTDFALPDEWTDDDLIDFCDNHIKWRQLEAHIGAELEETNKWIDELIEYRKACYKPGNFERVVDKINSFISDAARILEENPEIADKFADLVIGLFDGEEKKETPPLM